MEIVHKILPLVIKDRQGQILEVSLSNEKGFKKSLERGKLWHINKETGRLLPFSEDPLLNISEHKTWYEAILSGGKDHDEPLEQKDLFNSIDNNKEIELQKTVVFNESAESKYVLGLLEQVVLQRQQQLPKGSYTTYLFESGAEKIRKKMGEEAIELILAPGREEIIYEAADLVYHMLVLLASENIAMDEIMSELEKRAVEG